MGPDDPKNIQPTNDPVSTPPTSPDGADMPPDPMQPAPAVFGAADNGSKKKMWLVVFIILFLLLAGFLAWWFLMKDDGKKPAPAASSNSSQQSNADEEATCADDFTAYQNESLDLQFCYPTAWGDVAVTDGKFAPADTGSRWTVSFADKDMVHLGVVSEDWTTAVARDGVCVDPATQVLPAFSPFSTAWETEGTPVTSGTRGVEVAADHYLIDEMVDDVLTNGVCLHGYVLVDGTYDSAAASYSAEFEAPITTPQQHITAPTTLISAADREDFAIFVKSIDQLP